MKIKLYTSYYNDLEMNREKLLSSEEHSYASEKKMGNIYDSRESAVRYFLSQNYYKLGHLGFLIGFIYENKCKNILSLGAGISVLEYLLKNALPEESVVCAADYDGFLVAAAKKFFPEISAVEFDFTKDDLRELKGKFNADFDLAVFFHSAYALDDDEFVKLFSDLKKSGVKYVIDFHAGIIRTKEVLKHVFLFCKNSAAGMLKKIKPLRSLWEKIKPKAAGMTLTGKFHGYGRTKGAVRRLYKKAGFTIIRESQDGGYTAVLAAS